ncbi:MAG TPA: hypothetical protein VL331_02455 [Croceibacterium sp.]|nr:hypothetical protein [Croceibacterium sp.]
MATVAVPQVSALQKERAFFFYMALAVLVTVLAGFGFFFAIGASSIHSPWWVHLHALSMGSWVLLFVTQTWFVYRGNVTAHRTLGPLAVAWSGWIFCLGFVVTALDVNTHRVPPFFQPNYFLMMDWLNMIAFGGLVIAAVRMRNRSSDWHKRLMLGAMLQLIAVAWGRLILPFLFDQRGIWLVMLALLAYFGVAMAWDKRNRGAVHPAYYWGAGTLVVWVSLSFALADLPPVLALTKSIAG